MKKYAIALTLCVSVLVTACAAPSIEIMPGAPDGCTRMISQGEASTDSVLATAGAEYCKYIEKGDCPQLSGMTFNEFREMCREL